MHFIPGKVISADLETTGLHPFLGDAPFMATFANTVGETWAFEFAVDPLTRRPIPKPNIIRRIKALIEDASIELVGANIKFDLRMLEVHHGIVRPPHAVTRDVLVAAHVCNSNERSMALKPLADKYVGITAGDQKELLECVKACRVKARKWGWNISKTQSGNSSDGESKAAKADYWLPAAVVRLKPPGWDDLLARFPRMATLCQAYGVQDTIRALKLDQLYLSLIAEDEGLKRTWERELRVAPIVYATETRGLRVDVGRAKSEILECDHGIARLRAQLVHTFGDFNEEVPDARLRAYLFGNGVGQCGLKPDPNFMTEKTKVPQVTKDVLERLVDRVPILANIMEYSKYRKVRGDYFQKYLSFAVPTVNGEHLIHTNFKQVGATTGRVSCHSPPLHQIPKRALDGDIMKRVRGPFGPRTGYVWLHNDYKSIEARIFGEEAQEDDIVRIFRSGGDPYVELRDRIITTTGLDLEAMFKGMGGARQVCKNNFLGWTYGEGIAKMARAMRLSRADAEQVIFALRGAYPKAQPFMREMAARAKRDGEVRNRYGRRVPIPPPARMRDEEMGIWKWVSFEYKAVNYLIQSTAADLLKEAMIRLDRRMKEWGDIYWVMNVHDELILEVREPELTPELCRAVSGVMADNQGMFKSVDTPVDSKITTLAWSDPADVGTYFSNRAVRTRVVNKQTEPFDVYIGRPSKWGNPFILKDERDRVSVLEQYRKFLMGRPRLIVDARRELKGKRLGCFCAPKACHGDVLARVADGGEP